MDEVLTIMREFANSPLWNQKDGSWNGPHNPHCMAAELAFRKNVYLEDVAEAYGVPHHFVDCLYDSDKDQILSFLETEDVESLAQSTFHWF